MQSGRYCFWCVQKNSIKASERRSRMTGEGIETTISGFDQPLPMEIDRFWSVSKNETVIQQIFTKWVLNKVKSEQFDQPLFLGGSHKEHDAMCVSFINGLVSVDRLLECTHERAEDRIFFQSNHTVKIGNYGSVVIASPDSDIFVSALHHFRKLMYFDLDELWFASGRGNSRTFFPIHGLANDLDSDIVEVLPAIHALAGCDTASKVGSKSRAVRKGADCYHLLHAFTRDALNNETIANSETFLLKCITKQDVDTFDKLRFIVYHEKYLEFDIERFPPTSDNIRQHIMRAYLRCYIWLHSLFLENIDLNPLEYGYRLTEDSNPVSIISTKPSIPSNFPQPCNCQKWSKASACKCQLLEIRCCQFCKCKVMLKLNWTDVCYVYRFCYIYFNSFKSLGTWF